MEVVEGGPILDRLPKPFRGLGRRRREIKGRDTQPEALAVGWSSSAILSVGKVSEPELAGKHEKKLDRETRPPDHRPDTKTWITGLDRVVLAS